MGPYGIREEKAGGPEQRDKYAGTSPFVLQNPKNQTEHTSSLKGLPKKNLQQNNWTTWHNMQHLHQCVTVSHYRRCVSSSSVLSDGKWTRGSCWQISAQLNSIKMMVHLCKSKINLKFWIVFHFLLETVLRQYPQICARMCLMAHV